MTLANASGAVSARNASTSSGVGGRPIRSSVARRISVRRSAGFTGSRPSRSRRARMKRSTSVFGHSAFFTDGAAGCASGWNDHHARCSGVIVLPAAGVALLGKGPSTLLGTGPSTLLGTGPSTLLGTGPSTLLGTGHGAPALIHSANAAIL